MLIKDIAGRSRFLVGNRDQMRARLKRLMIWAQRQELKATMDWYTGLYGGKRDSA